MATDARPPDGPEPGSEPASALSVALFPPDGGDVRNALSEALANLQPPARLLSPEERRREESAAPVLAFVDLTGDGPRPAEVRRRLGPGVPLVALLEGDDAERLVDALSAGCEDYLFFPLNPAELGLLWKGHLEGQARPGLVLEEGEGSRLTMIIPSDVRYLRPALRRVLDAFRLLEWAGEAAAFRVRAAVGEALSNAVLYGNRQDPSRRVRVGAEMRPREVRITVTDEGDGFDPDAVPDPTRPDRVQESHGRGLFLLRTLMDEVRFNDVGNEVTLVLRKRDGDG